MLTIQKTIDRLRASIETKLKDRATHVGVRDAVREACTTEDRAPTEDEATSVREAQDSITAIDAELDQLRSQLDDAQRELRADEAAQRLSEEFHGAGGIPTRSTEERVQVTREPRTYDAQRDPKGRMFLRDVALSYIGGFPQANERLANHMREETVEREAAGRPLLDRAASLEERAVGTSAFAGLVVPQYLVDLAAPYARAARPFADACRHHDLPESGMTVDISTLTTGTSAGVQSAQNAAVSETDADDTLISPAVQTVAGQQTVSRQAVMRGSGIEDTLMGDLVASYHTTLDSTLINQATNGLTNVATAITYTDATPTAAELYPKLVQGSVDVEAVVLNQDAGDTIAVMHSRRWGWVQSQLSTSWPLFGQPGVQAQLAGVNFGERYGSGVRGVLPNGTPVIVDNNISTALGAGTEDEIYFSAQSESHLWEDPNAPMFIRAEQTKAASLGVLLVVYGFMAYTFARRSGQAQKISGTGLIAPTF